MDFEHKSAECVFLRVYAAFLVSTGRGDGAIFTKQSSSSLTPKVLSAEPKKTGASLPHEVFVDIKVGIDSFD